MKPRGIRTTLVSNLDYETGEINRFETAIVTMVPDTEGGLFIAPPTGGDRIDVPIEPEDARQFLAGASEEAKQEIMEKYVQRNPKREKVYRFPSGASLGTILITEALEVDKA